MEKRCLDLRGERCPVLLSRIICALEDGPVQTRLTIFFDDPRLVRRMPPLLLLYGGQMVETQKIAPWGWRAVVQKVP